MVTAEQVNLVLDALSSTLKERLPLAEDVVAGPFECVRLSGAYGAVAMGAVFLGDMEGQLTITMGWESATGLVQKISKHRLEVFDDAAQRALEDVLLETLSKVSRELEKRKVASEIMPLPFATDTHVPLGLDREIPVVRVSLTLLGNPVWVHFSFRGKA